MVSYLPPVRCIIEKRYAMKRRMKYTALILLLISTTPITYYSLTILHGYIFESDPNFSILSVLFWSDFMDSFIFSAMLGIPALILIFMNNPLTNWLLPISPVCCPQCGQSTQHLTVPRCPECGLDLPKCLVNEVKEVNP